MAAVRNWEVEQMDAVTAFMNSDIDNDVYIELPPAWKDMYYIKGDYICKLLKALYGLKQSPRLWQKKLRDTLIKLGFNPLKSDNCVYISQSGVIIITYVDDMLITGPDTQGIKDIKKALQDKFEMDDLGAAAYFLGVQIIQDCTIRSITLI